MASVAIFIMLHPLAIAFIYFGLWIWAKKAPLPALYSALAIYVLMQIGIAVIEPQQLFQGWLWKAIICSGLAAGIRANLVSKKLKEALRTGKTLRRRGSQWR